MTPTGRSRSSGSPRSTHPQGITASIAGGKITVERAEQPMVVPFRVEDADGGAATGSLYVPAANSGLPYVQPDALIRLKPGGKVVENLADYVINPSGGPLSFTLKSRMWASPETKLTSTVTGDGTFRVSAAASYAGPGAVVFEVTTGTSVDDPDGIEATLSVPVQVGETRPILRCPDDPIEVPQAESRRIDIGALCHVWTADPAQADGLTYTADFDDGVRRPDRGHSCRRHRRGDRGPVGRARRRSARSGRRPRGATRAGSAVRVVRTPPPSLAPIRVSTLKAGETPDHRPGPLPDRPASATPCRPWSTAQQLTNLGVQISSSGSSVTIRTGAKVARPRGLPGGDERRRGPSRARPQGRGPDRARHPRCARPPGRAGAGQGGARLQGVASTGGHPQSNGSPRRTSTRCGTSSGTCPRCGGTSCDITGLTNGTTYRFWVRAHNAVGFSEWSGGLGRRDARRAARPGRPDQARRGRRRVPAHPLEARGDQGGAEVIYVVQWAGGSADLHHVQRRRSPASTTTVRYQFTGPARERVHDRWRPDLRLDAADRDAVHAGAADADRPGDRGLVRGGVALPGPPSTPTARRRCATRSSATASALPACTNILKRGCDNAGLAYDGHVYLYSVRATNSNGKGEASAHGSGHPVAGHGKPASWGAWSLQPTGSNNQARATFTVPSSRGAESQVRVYADGVKVQQLAGPGPHGGGLRGRQQPRSARGHARGVQRERCLHAVVGADRADLRPAHPGQHPHHHAHHRRSPRSPGPSRWTATATPRRSR